MAFGPLKWANSLSYRSRGTSSWARYCLEPCGDPRSTGVILPSYRCPVNPLRESPSRELAVSGAVPCIDFIQVEERTSASSAVSSTRIKLLLLCKYLDQNSRRTLPDRQHRSVRLRSRHLKRSNLCRSTFMIIKAIIVSWALSPLPPSWKHDGQMPSPSF